MTVTAIIVARGGSQRLPRKALQPFGESTLVGHKVDQLLRCRMIDEVVVGSDDQEILTEAEAHGAQTRKRDAYHCSEKLCSANAMIRNMAAMVHCDVVVWAHPTNPCCPPEVYDAAVKQFHADQAAKSHDSLCSVTKIQRHAWAPEAILGQHRPVNFLPHGKRHPLAAELEPFYFQDGAIFIQPHRQMLENSYFYGFQPRLFEVSATHGVDVDTAKDLQLARSVYAGMPQHRIFAAHKGDRGTVRLDGEEVEALRCCPEGGWVVVIDSDNPEISTMRFGRVEFTPLEPHENSGAGLPGVGGGM